MWRVFLFDFSLNNVTCYSVSEKLNKLLNYVIEYETPKVVTVHNVSIGLIRWILAGSHSGSGVVFPRIFFNSIKTLTNNCLSCQTRIQRVLLSILVSRRQPICQCVTLEMSAPNSFNAGTIDIIASWATLKTIVTGDQTNDCPSLVSPSDAVSSCWWCSMSRCTSSGTPRVTRSSPPWSPAPRPR